MNGHDSGFALAMVGLGNERGQVAMACCPGRAGALLLPSNDTRSLQRDVATLLRWGAQALVTLLDDIELAKLHLQDLPRLLSASGIAWHHVPLNPKRLPDVGFEHAWTGVARGLTGILRDGGKVAVHCRDGRTRAGMVAARLLIEAGCPPQDAINRVRAARPGAIEHPGVEQYVLRQVPRPIREEDAQLSLLRD